jgi:hypothetical protein
LGVGGFAVARKENADIAIVYAALCDGLLSFSIIAEIIKRAF